ncbi:hypothetical protein RRG08_014225 [Elysia crispata]|uniref:Uncharacterized protein n=1 Tax=Elysia crispata TaxID=231223 RepID=A0AAE1CF51_9GAST|nr:hypothetical protein RRG08_014225 [Elysia crispata]
MIPLLTPSHHKCSLCQVYETFERLDDRSRRTSPELAALSKARLITGQRSNLSAEANERDGPSRPLGWRWLDCSDHGDSGKASTFWGQSGPPLIT